MNLECIDCIFYRYRNFGHWCDYMNIWLPDTTPCDFYRENEVDE